MRHTLILLFLSLTITAPGASAQHEQSTRIAVISDLNGRYGSTDYDRRVALAIAAIIARKPDLVISTGDMVAGQQMTPNLSRQQVNAMWRSFRRTVSEPLREAGIPLIMTPGNHDASAYSGYELEREIYARERNRDGQPPGLLPGHNFPFHYAFVYHDILFLSLDATTRGPLGERQEQWLRGVLGPDTDYRATIAFGHLPLQPIAIGREKDVVQDPELERLLAAHAPAAYLSGHHHAFYPGWRDGIQMLSMGNLGGNQRTLVGTNQRTGFSFAWLVVAADGTISINALTANAFNRALPAATLPKTLGSGHGRLIRSDLIEVQPQP